MTTTKRYNATHPTLGVPQICTTEDGFYFKFSDGTNVLGSTLFDLREV